MADTSQSDFNNTTTKDEPIIVDDQDHDAPTAERHPRFYFEDGNVTFLVNNQLYRVYRYPLIKTCTVFASLFSLPQDGNARVEGSSDDYPIVLHGVPRADFEALVTILFPVLWDSTETIPVKVWMACMSAADRWEAPSLRQKAIQALASAPPAARLATGRSFNLPEWVKLAWAALKETPLSRLTAEDLVFLKSSDIVRLIDIRGAAVREQLQVYAMGHSHRPTYISEQTMDGISNL